ncbi:MAG: M15 family metallopeptidase [Xanthomonadales bacterium]|nr:M15 family metallopeptidase [Xanthomonadales bacterium]
MSKPTTPAEQILKRRIRALGIPRDYGRQHQLRRLREPLSLISIGRDIHDREQHLTPPAANAWRRMRDAAADAGVILQPVSAFRSIDYQIELIENKLARGQAIEQILAVNAAPEFSEHHSGRALDLTTPGYPSLEEAFENSPAFAWLQQHAHTFRFALSYPRDNPNGIIYEPWHWCWQR